MKPVVVSCEAMPSFIPCSSGGMMCFFLLPQFEFGRYVTRTGMDGTAQATGVCGTRALIESTVRREVCSQLALEGMRRF